MPENQFDFDAGIAQLLRDTRTIAMIGASNDPARPSYGVMGFLLKQGYRVFPVNPMIAGQQVHGVPVRASPDEIGIPVDLVDIFRRSDAAGEAVDAAIAIGAKAVWMQIGVIDEEAAARAEAAGLKVVMNHCLKIEIQRLGIQPVSRSP